MNKIQDACSHYKINKRFIFEVHLMCTKISDIRQKNYFTHPKKA